MSHYDFAKSLLPFFRLLHLGAAGVTDRTFANTSTVIAKDAMDSTNLLPARQVEPNTRG